MRTTRFFSLALSGVLVFSATSFALAQDNPPSSPSQAQPGPGARRMDPDRQLQRLTQELSLTSDQQDKIKPLLVDRAQKIQALFQDESLSPEDRRMKARTISEGTNNSIKALLTDDQKQKFDAMQERMRQRGGHGGPPPPAQGAPPPQQ